MYTGPYYRFISLNYNHLEVCIISFSPRANLRNRLFDGAIIFAQFRNKCRMEEALYFQDNSNEGTCLQLMVYILLAFPPKPYMENVKVHFASRMLRDCLQNMKLVQILERPPKYLKISSRC
jgi:hypothetical protein